MTERWEEVELHRTQYMRMCMEAMRQWPNESCGMLIRYPSGPNLYFTPSDNMAVRYGDASVEFQVDPLLQRRTINNGYTIVGSVHSHPRTNPEPSGLDIATYEAMGPGSVHLIIGLKDGQPRVTAWTVDPGVVGGDFSYEVGGPKHITRLVAFSVKYG